MNAQTAIKMPLVYQRIAAVQGELAQTGIGKNSENTFDRYKFRGIDAVYNALAPLLAKHGLCVLPRMLERDCQERTSRKGEPMFYVTVTAEFDFVAAEDGSSHTVRTYGEAMDRSDKATNKAMSAAYKYAAFMAFAIPTEGDNDADASTPEVTARGSGMDNSEARQVSHTGPALSTRDDPFPQGPAKNKTELKTMGRELWREIEGCGDDIELTCLLSSEENVKLVKQIKDALPIWWDGQEKDGEIHDGLADVIARKQKEFTAQALENMG